MGKIDISMDEVSYKKWLPVIEKKFDLRNDILNRLTCLYCEWYSNTSEPKSGSDLANRLIEVYKNIMESERVVVSRQFFNPSSGIFENQLENGDFVPINGNIKYDISYSEKIRIFGIDFVKDLDIQEFRDRQISEIL